MKTVETHAQAAAWGKNPLLFSLAAAVFVSKGVLPTSRAALYREVIDAILKMRDPDWKETLRSIEAELALKLYQANQRTFTRYDLFRLLSEIHREQSAGANWDTHNKIAQRIINSGTLEVVAHETYGFRHQTFQEYLAAMGLSQQIISSDRARGEKLAWEMRTYSRWTEALRLMVGELSQLEKFSESYKREGREAAQNWLQKLIDQRMTEEGDPGNLGLALVLKSLNEITEANWWRQTTTMSLAKKALSIWVDELFSAVRENQQGKRERLESLAQDVSHLPRQVVDETLKRLVQALGDQDRSIRNMACEVLQGLRQGPTELLIEALGNTDASVRQAALKVLGAQRKQVPLEPLFVALHDDNSDVRQTAGEAFLKQAEHMPLEQLLELLHSDDWIIQAIAVDALGELGEDAPLEPLLSALHDKKGSVRGRAVGALVKLGDRVPIEPLLAVLQDDGDDDDNDSSGFFPSSFYVRYPASQALIEQGKRIPLEFLLDRLFNGTGYEQIMAVQALAYHQDERVINPLIHTALHDDYYLMRAWAVKALGKQGQSVPLEYLIHFLRDEDINVQNYAIQALAQREEEAALEPLLSSLDSPALTIVGPSILTTLGERVPRATLLDLLRHNIPEIRCIIGAILEKSPEEVPLGDILTALHDEKERLAAIKILEKQKKTDSFELLMSLIYDKNYDVRTAAFKALEQQPDRVPRELLLELLRDDAVRSNVIEVLRRQKEGLQLELLKDFSLDPYVQSIFLDVIDRDRDKDPGDLEILTIFLQFSNEKTRYKAIRVFKNLGSFTPPESLMAFLHHDIDYVRQAAVTVLGELDGQVPIDIFLQAMHDTDSSVQYSAAAVVLKRLLKQQIRGGTPIPEEYIKAADDINYLIRPQIICDLWAEGEGISLETFLHILQHKDFGVSLQASMILEDNAEKVPLNILIELLSSKENRIKKSAIKALEEKGETFPIEPLLPLLDDEDRDIRCAVVALIGKQDKYAPIQQLLPLLHDPDIGVRCDVVKVLGKLGQRVPTEHFLPLLHDEDNSVRYEVITTVKERIPRDHLLLLLYDNDGNVRSAAITALGEQGEAVSTEYFLEALGDQAEQVRSAALEVLNTRAPDALADVTKEAIAILNGEPAGTILGSIAKTIFCQQAGEMQLASRELLDELTKLLSWPHWQVRVSAAKALGSIRRKILKDAILGLRTLRLQDPVHTVRKAADDALAEILSLETSDDD